jgi:hypothetical protein
MRGIIKVLIKETGIGVIQYDNTKEVFFDNLGRNCTDVEVGSEVTFTISTNWSGHTRIVRAVDIQCIENIKQDLRLAI